MFAIILAAGREDERASGVVPVSVFKMSTSDPA